MKVPKIALYAVIRIKGKVGVRKVIKDTLAMLRLHRVNHCVLVPKNPNYEGMLEKVLTYVTWGEVKPQAVEKLILKRGRIGNKKLEAKEANLIVKKVLKGELKSLPIKPVFRLSPPSKGYKSIKLLYPKGDFGYRGEKINELLERMI